MMLSLLHLDLRLLGGRGGERNGWLKIPAESTLYHISGFPEKMGEPMLYKFFTDAGLDSRRLQFIWINGTSCFLQIDAPLALSDEEVKNGIKPQKDIQFYMKGVNFEGTLFAVSDVKTICLNRTLEFEAQAELGC